MCKKGNTIISDGWAGYQFLDSPNSGYSHIIQNHSFGSFGYGLESTSYIEAIWKILKSKIKSIYHVIPYKNLMRFVKEVEFKYIIRNKSYNEKIKEIFDCFDYFQNVEDDQFYDNEFLNDSNDDYDISSEVDD